MLQADSLEAEPAIPVGLVPLESEEPRSLAALDTAGEERFYVVLPDPSSVGVVPHIHGDPPELPPIPGRLAEVSLAQGQLRWVAVEADPVHVLAHPSEGLLFVSHFSAFASRSDRLFDRILVVNAAELRVEKRLTACPGIADLAFARGGDTLLAACFLTDELLVIERHSDERWSVPVGNEPARPPSQPRYGPFSVNVSPIDGLVWVGNAGSSEVVVLDIDSREQPLVRQYPVGGEPRRGVFSRDAASYLVAVSASPDQVAILPTDGSDDVRMIPIPAEICEEAYELRLHPVKDELAYLLCRGDGFIPGAVIEIDVATATVQRTKQLESGATTFLSLSPSDAP